ncbi:membrane-fusion protein [Vibrio ishigakensis]|uniref:Membrane-fusion protein n=1 Tax=Vibrio ishigakensis TaxID=1481914 RepID=A0A0B8NZE9_9VIBR|nr:efflux RND transporter periplasmic adaptor subunit [Vibrio ishigakensis]GAM59341.1 membrane-fusion protein [Vibrio ishigakensis]
MKRIITITAIASLLSGCFGQTQQHQAPPLVLKTFQVDQVVELGSRDFIGVTIPAELTPISFLADGEITSLSIKSGDRVSKGDVLASLDNTRIKQQLKEAKIELDLANKQLDRAKRLQKQKMISAAEFDGINSNFKLASIQYKSLQRRLDQTQLIAPFDALVATVEKEQAQNVTTAEPVLTLYRTDRIHVDLNVTEEVLLSLNPQVGKEVSVQFEAFAEPVSGKLMLWSEEPTVNRSNYLMRFEIQELDRKVLPGTSAHVTIPLENQKNEPAYLIPANILVPAKEQGAFDVWLYQDNKPTKQSVEVYSITKQGAVISQGLEQGDLLITNQLSKLTQNREFKIAGEATK